jgi:hypothetical protein
MGKRASLHRLYDVDLGKRTAVCGMIIGTGTTRPCRLCLARFVGKLDTKPSIIRKHVSWGVDPRIVISLYTPRMYDSPLGEIIAEASRRGL